MPVVDMTIFREAKIWHKEFALVLRPGTTLADVYKTKIKLKELRERYENNLLCKKAGQGKKNLCPGSP